MSHSRLAVACFTCLALLSVGQRRLPPIRARSCGAALDEHLDPGLPPPPGSLSCRSRTARSASPSSATPAAAIAAAGSRRPDGRVAGQVPVRVRADAGRQHLRRAARRHDYAASSSVLSRAARRRRDVPRRHRQSRRPRPDQLRAVQHGRPALLHLPRVRAPAGRPGRRRRPLLRARQPVARSAQLEWLRARAGRFRDGVEDLLLPSSALHVGPLPRRRARASPRARADPRRGDVDVVLAGHEHFYERIHRSTASATSSSGARRLAAARGHPPSASPQGFDTGLPLHADGDRGKTSSTSRRSAAPARPSTPA